ncbi:MAG: SigE family RNA polymerase sigma factor [Dermatophilaceae bacterium]
MHDKAGFERFVRESTPTLWRQAWALTGSQHDAADLLQETFVKVGAAWRRVDGSGNPVGYARMTMTRLHINGWRSRTRRPESVVAQPPERAQRSGTERIDDQDAIRRSLAGLPPVQRAVLVLTYLEDRSDAEISGTLGCAVGTVRSHRSRARAALRIAETTGDHDPEVTTR